MSSLRIHRRFALGLLLALLLPALARIDTHAGDGQRPPNIVFILADDLGIHDLGCDGRKEHRTPRLDRLAAEGVRFTSAYCAQPICSPSRAALLTGLTPARLHLTTYLPGRADAPSQKVLHPVIRQHLPLETVTLAEHLRPLGYATACVGKWHLGGPSFGPAAQGFDVVHAGTANTTPSDTEGGKGEFDLTRHANAFIEQNRDRPFLLYLAHNTPHIPYTAQPGLIDRHRGTFEPTYAALLESMDTAVGQVLDTLDRLGLRDRTLVIFTSDNGGLHVPELRHARITHNGRYRAGKGHLYEGGLRIPLLVRWPGHIPAAKVIDTPVLNTDWVPTLLELAGHPVPAGTLLDGVSFARLLTHGSPPRRTGPLAWHFPHYTNQGGRPGGAVRDGNWKLIHFDDTHETELYHLSNDPGETRNRAASHPRRVRSLHAALNRWRAAVGAQTNSPNPAFDPDRFHALYRDPDPSRFAPATASPAEWDRIATWRRGMDAAHVR